jgi:hypothetical protein
MGLGYLWQRCYLQLKKLNDTPCKDSVLKITYAYFAGLFRCRVDGVRVQRLEVLHAQTHSKQVESTLIIIITKAPQVQ